MTDPCRADETSARTPTGGPVSADRRELARLRTFSVGRPGSGDLRAAFVIDGRDYDGPDLVRADIAAAVAELHRRGLPAQFTTEPVQPDSPHPDLPGWQAWNTSPAG